MAFGPRTYPLLVVSMFRVGSPKFTFNAVRTRAGAWTTTPIGWDPSASKAAGTRALRGLSLKTEQPVPLPKEFFQFVPQNLGPGLQKQMRCIASGASIAA